MNIVNTFRPNSQNDRYLRALLQGPVFTQSRYRDHGLMFGYLASRTRDLNERCLNNQGYEVVKESVGTNNWKYSIAPIRMVA
jgi:hypothetical protein